MARMVSLQNMMDRARRAADMERSTVFISDAELIDLLNEGVPELYDLLVAAYGEDYFHKTELSTFTAAKVSYPLPADFFKLKGVDVESDTANSGDWLPIRRFEERQRTMGEGYQSVASVWIEYRLRGATIEFKPPPADTRRYRAQYVPTAPVLVKETAAAAAVDAGDDTITLTDHGLFTKHPVRVSTDDTLPAGLAASTTYYVIIVDADTISLATSEENADDGTAVDITDGGTGTHTVLSMFDGVNGWEKLPILTAAISMLAKEESDTRALERERDRMWARLERMADNRDQGEPAVIQDVQGDMEFDQSLLRWPPP